MSARSSSMLLGLGLGLGLGQGLGLGLGLGLGSGSGSGSGSGLGLGLGLGQRLVHDDHEVGREVGKLHERHQQHVPGSAHEPV